MKKLLIYALLLVTGFAFYSCDDRFDNPVSKQQDPSNPKASWTYEVNIKFAQWSFWNGEENLVYKAPTTVYVYNADKQFLGELKATEEFNYDNFNWDTYYKFSGTLKGAIGEKLLFSTLKDFDYYSKQDGTIESLMENSILEIAEAPIIIANSTTGKIATQNVQLKSKINAMKWSFSNSDFFNKDTDKGFTFIGDSLLATESIKVDFAEKLNPNEPFYFAFASEAKTDKVYTIEIDSENGYKSYNYFNGIFNNGTQGVWWEWTDMWFDTVKELDLTKYYAYLKKNDPEQESYWVGINGSNNAPFEAQITQSGKDAVPVHLIIRGKATIKDINIGKKGHLGLEGGIFRWWDYENNSLPTLTVKGNNTIYNEEFAGIAIEATATIQGDGTINSTGADHGLVVNNSWNTETQDNNGWSTKGEASVLTIAGNVTIIANGLHLAAVYVGKPNAWSYPPYSEEQVSCTLNLNSGTLEAVAKDDGQPAVLIDGTLNIGPKATMLKGTAEKSELVIANGATWTELAKFDEKKYNDSGAKDGVRTITPKK